MTKSEKSALRQRRKERLAKYAEEGQTPSDSGQSYPEKEAEAAVEPVAEAKAEPVVEAAAEPTPAPESVPAPAPEPELVSPLVAEVMPLDQIPADAAIDMVLFQHEENPKWAVFANSIPVAEICLLDQHDPQNKLRSLFEKESYAATLRKAFSQQGFVKTLEDIKARPYTTSIEKSEAMATITAQVQQEQENAYRQKRAETADDLLHSISLVNQAMEKNFIVKNPLKAAIYDALEQVGTHNPVQVVEDAFKEAGTKYFETVIDTAKQWANMHAEALAQLEEQINKAGHRIPESDGAESMADRIASTATIPINVPLETAGNAPSSSKDELKKRLQLGRKR